MKSASEVYQTSPDQKKANEINLMLNKDKKEIENRNDLNASIYTRTKLIEMRDNNLEILKNIKL